MNDKDRTALPAKVMECVCPHDFQDKRYGRWMRVHNPKSDKSGTKWRCTVCGREKE